MLTTDELKAIADRFHLHGVNIPVAMRTVEAAVIERCAQLCDSIKRTSAQNDGLDSEYEVGLAKGASRCASAIRRNV